jgi:hypothetical protein
MRKLKVFGHELLGEYDVYSAVLGPLFVMVWRPCQSYGPYKWTVSFLNDTRNCFASGESDLAFDAAMDVERAMLKLSSDLIKIIAGPPKKLAKKTSKRVTKKGRA